MPNNPYSGPTEKFATARRMLMLPANEVGAIAKAFRECKLGLRHLTEEDLGDDDLLVSSMRSLRALMDTKGLQQNSSGRGLLSMKAAMLTSNEKTKLAGLVNDLADAFDSKRRYFHEHARSGR